MRLCIAEMHGSFDNRATLAGLVAIAFDQYFPIQVEPESLSIFAGVAVVHPDTNLVISSGWRNKGAAPAHGVAIALQAIYRNNLVPIEIDIPIRAREHRLSTQVFGAEVLAGEAIAGTAGGMERRVLNRDGEIFNQG